MEHASSSSLISLGLTTDASLEGSSFRWGLVASIVLHALIIVMAMFVRLHTDSEQPFRAISVSLITLPTALTPKPSPAPPPTKKSAVAPKPQTAPPPAPSPKIATAPPIPAPTPQAVAPPEEEALPPLPTGTTSERLSESLGGAINSIIVPQKHDAVPPTIASQQPAPKLSEDTSPLLENLRLPSAPPTIARPKRLKPAEQLKIPSRTAPSTSIAQKTQVPSKTPSQPSTRPKVSAPPTVIPAPALPSLNDVTPFKKPKQASVPRKSQPPAKIAESLERSLPKVQAPFSRKTFPKISKGRPAIEQQQQPATPQVSAPQLSKIPDPRRTESSIPAQQKMSDTVKKLMDGLKSTAPRPTPKQVPLQPSKPTPRTTPAIKPPPSSIDQRIAKLSIPQVDSVQSIKKQLKLLEVQPVASPGSSASEPSDGKNRYLAMVEERIDRQWVAPRLLVSNPVVVLKFHISRSGKISAILITESSGHAHYDSAAQRAVQAVNPLPAFPNDVSDSFFDVQYRFIKD